LLRVGFDPPQKIKFRHGLGNCLVELGEFAEEMLDVRVEAYPVFVDADQDVVSEPVDILVFGLAV